MAEAQLRNSATGLNDPIKDCIQRVQLLIFSILDLQERLEEVNRFGDFATFFSQRIFRSPFIKAVRVCAEFMIKVQNHPGNQIFVVNNLWVSLVEQIISVLSCQISGIIAKDANYFGSRDDYVPRCECTLLVNFFSWLVDQNPWENIDRESSSTKKESISLSNYFTNVSKGDISAFGQSIDPIEDLFGTFTGNLVTKLFWLKYFPWTTYVRWTDFKRVFCEHYAIKDHSQTHALSALECLLTITGVEKFPEHQHPCGRDVVSYRIIHSLLNEYDATDKSSLFHMYQDVCDPQTSVVVMGQLMDQQGVSYRSPTVLRSLLGYKVTQISCGDQHMAVIVDPGMVYTWGKGVFGRLGLGHEMDVAEPQLVTHFQQMVAQRIVQVSCGFAFTGFVSELGRLYMCGAGMNGRLGLGTDSNETLPEFVQSLSHEHIIKVQNGSVHSVMLTKTGQVYACGKADFTGHGSRVDILTPLPVASLVDVHIVDIAVGSGGFHTLALSKQGQMYTWGHNRVGQLAIIADHHMPRNEDGGYYVPTPQLVTSHCPQPITRVSAGWGHTSVLGDNGDVYVCGRNVERQLGVDANSGRFVNERGHYYQPHLLPTYEGDLALVRVSQVACGGEHTLFHTCDYEIVGVGLNRAGQLGDTSLTSGSSGSHNSSNSYFVSSNEDAHDSQLVASPRTIDYFTREKRRILQLSCGFSCSMVLLGAREPASLRALCTRVLRATPHLRDQVLTWQQERNAPAAAQQSSAKAGSSAHDSTITSKPINNERNYDEIFAQQGCYAMPIVDRSHPKKSVAAAAERSSLLLYQDLDTQQNISWSAAPLLPPPPPPPSGSDFSEKEGVGDESLVDEELLKEVILNALK